MGLTLAEFTQFLVDECEDTGTTAYLDGLLAKAREEIKNGNGSISSIESASANGKHVNQKVELTFAEVALACRQAKRIYNGVAGSGPLTFIDFGGGCHRPHCA